jgi:hypothetical protein
MGAVAQATGCGRAFRSARLANIESARPSGRVDCPHASLARGLPPPPSTGGRHRPRRSSGGISVCTKNGQAFVRGMIHTQHWAWRQKTRTHNAEFMQRQTYHHQLFVFSASDAPAVLCRVCATHKHAVHHLNVTGVQGVACSHVALPRPVLGPLARVQSHARWK